MQRTLWIIADLRFVHVNCHSTRLICDQMIDTPDEESEKQVMLNGKSIYDLLPRQKNSKGEETEHPQLPTTRKMVYGIEDRLGDYSRADVCKGLASDAELFDYDVDLDVDTEDEEGTVVSDEDNREEASGTSLQEMAKKRAEQSGQITAGPSVSPLAPRSPYSNKSLAAGGQSPAIGGNKVAENLLEMKKSGRTLSRYSKTLR